MHFYKSDPSSFEDICNARLRYDVEHLERNGKGLQQMHHCQRASLIESTNQHCQNFEPVLDTPTNQNSCTIMQLCIQPQISPEHDLDMHDFTNDIIVDGQLESSSDHGSEALPIHTYLPMDTMEAVVNDTYSPNFMENVGNCDDFLSIILFKYKPLEKTLSSCQYA